MKLNPPASSSDLDEARAVARRLHQRATGQDVSPAPGDTPAVEAPAPDATTPSTAPAPPRTPPAARPLKLSPAPPETAPPPPPPVDPYPEPEAGEDELVVSTEEDVEVEEPGPAPFPVSTEVEPEESWAAEPEAGPPEVGSYEEDDEDEEMDPAEASGSNPFQPGPFEISVPGLDEDEEETPAEDAGAAPVQGEAVTDDTGVGPSEELDAEGPALEVDEPASPEDREEPAGEWEASEEKTAPGAPSPPDVEMGPDETPPEDALVPEPTLPPEPWALEPDGEGPAPSDDALSALTEDAPEPTLEELEAPADSVSPEDLVSGWGEVASSAGELEGSELEPEVAPDDLSTPPSWDDLADACLVAARAHGIMIVDPTGQVVTARGQWPEPGPEAIGRRLVAMMEKTLGDAPTRSVSAPLAGEHLTAWRVPVAEGYLTVVFMAESTLDNDARGAVDGEIHRTLGQ